MERSRRERSGGKRLVKLPGRSTVGRDDRERFLKIVGVILVSTMVIGVFSSIWFGWKIRSGLTSLDHEKRTSQALGEKRFLLETRRTQLMAKDVIEKKASVLGLGKPGRRQVIRP